MKTLHFYLSVALISILSSYAQASSYTYTTLDDPNATSGTLAYGINNAGQVTGYFVNDGADQHGFVYNGGTYTTLDDPNATAASGTFGYGINDAGQVSGHFANGTAEHGFVYNGGTYTTLDDPNAMSMSIFIDGLSGLFDQID